MKIIRYFIAHRDEETGMDGFMPLWVPKSSNFDPASAQGMVHDMLEHQLCDTGAYHEELMAFGRMAALRSLNGIIPSDMYPPEDFLGIELAGIWSRSQEDCYKPLTAAPTTAEVDECAEQFICALVRKFAETCKKEAADRGQPEEYFLPDANHRRSMRSWLRIGYRDAQRRYGQIDHGCYDVGNAAFGWAEHNDKRLYALAEECPGSVLRMCFDTVRLRMKDTLIEPNNAYGDFPQWLRSRIWTWRNH